MAEYPQVASAPPLAATPSTNWTPTRAPSLEADVLVPLLQATVSALVLTLAATMLVWGMEWLPPWPFAGICFALTLAAAWLIAIADWQGTLWRIEERSGINLDGDPHIGKPPPVRLLEVYSAPPSQPMPADPATAETRRRLCEFVRGCWLDGKPNTALRAWDKSIGRAQWEEWRGLLLRLGYAVEDKSGTRNSPWRLRQDATTTIRQMFGPPRPPPPRAE